MQPNPSIPTAVSRHMAAIGAKGGAAGTGQAKTRPLSHYKKAAKLRWKLARLARKGAK